MSEPGSDPDPAFADLLDELLDEVFEGRTPDLEAIALRHPAVAHRVAEAFQLASGVASRRETRQPSLRGYRIVRELGRGGMGTVYLARQEQLDREVAIKVLPHSFGLSAASRQRFLEEAKALARVHHEHIVGIHRVVDDGDLLAFEMEYVDGPSLQELLMHLRQVRDGGQAPSLQHVAERLALPVAALGAHNLTTFFVRLAEKIARALGAVHAAGFVHRDVKPANVLLRANGEPVLADFGLVRDTALERSHRSGFAGTPVYSSPEQLRGGAVIGPPADVYALAVTLYECLALAPPFAGRTTTDLLSRIEHGRMPPLRTHAPHAPRDLETIVAHALDVEPARRYADGAAFADDLQRLLVLQPIHARPVGLVRLATKFLRRNRLPLLAAMAGAVLVAATLLPMLGSVEAAERTRQVVRDHVRTARRELLSPDCRRAAWFAAWGNSAAGAASHSPGVAALQRAIDGYGEALAVAPQDRPARRERAVAQVLLWLRQLSLQHAGSLAQALAQPDYRALAAALPQRTRAVAESIAAGKVAALDLDAVTTGCSDDDRASLGLLSFLAGEFRLCEAVWQVAPDTGDAGDQPLRDACLGLLYLDGGAPERAYVRLQAAQRELSESTFALELADAALAMGETALARQWLAAAPDRRETAAERRRVRADLEVATGDEGAAAATYEDLVAKNPLDPTPQHRLAQLAARRGDFALAAQRLDVLLLQWPGIARFRLDRARTALQQRDVPAYLRQVRVVLAAAVDRRSALRPSAELLEVLRIGGLTRLHRTALADSRLDRSGSTFLGSELPLQAILPARVVAGLEAMLPALASIDRSVTDIQVGGPTLDGTAGTLFVTLPLALARLPVFTPWLSPMGRAAGEATPWLVRAVLPKVLPPLRRLAVELLPTGWSLVPFVVVTPPADLSPRHVFGSSLVRGADWNGDGIAEVLVGCESTSPATASGRVFVVDGRSASILAEVVSDSDEHLLGHALALVGDLDGDSVADWIAGAPAGSKMARHGEVELRSGKDQRLIERIAGDSVSFGVDVAGLGDVNGDGVADFAVGMPPLVSNAAGQGQVLVYSGRTRQALRVLDNDVPGAWFGASLANAGDCDGDGVADLVVGGNLGRAPGLVRLYSGRTWEVLQSWNDAAPDSGFGNLVAAPGDLDGDGRGDVAVSALQPVRGTEPGQVHLFSGRTGARLTTLVGDAPGGCFGAAVVRYDVPHRRAPLLAIGSVFGGGGACGQVEFWTPRGDRVSTVLGSGPLSLFGARIVTTDDIDGDGRPELYIAEPRSNLAGRVVRVDSTTVKFGR